MKFIKPQTQKIALGAGAIATALTLGAAPASAATLIYDFDVAIDSGRLTGETYSGSFEFDNALLAGMGEEFLALDAFSLTFDGLEYTEEDDELGEAFFFDGEFLGLGFNTDAFSLIPGFEDTSDAFFAYDIAGAGNITYTERTLDPAKTPEPAGLLALGLMGVAIAHRRRRSA